MKKISTLFLAAGACALSMSVQAQLISEGFEGAVPPTGWTIDNPDGDGTWMQASVGKTGASSAYIDVFNFPAASGPDALITGTVNLSSVSSPTFTFWYAYQMYSDPASYTTADALNVHISTDGGTTWTSIYSKSGNSLVTAATQFSGTAAYVPAASEWVMETVDVSAYATATSAKFKIEWVNDWENNPHIDDILLAGSGAGVHELNLDAYVNVFPNPSTGNFNVDLAAFDMGQTNIIVYNMVGEEVATASYNVTAPKRARFDLSAQPNGVYFVKVQTATGSSTKKLVINH